MAGTTPEVAGYSDLAEIGRGGFARVYRAHQDRFNRSVALKVLNLADPDERTRDRFERECQAMGELSWHPHVVAVYDSGITDDGHLWLAMEHLERGSLADATLATSVMDWPAAVTAGVEVCGALGAAHAAGTLHRDLKPENVLVGPFGEAKLADFGIAAVDGGRRTTTGVASFTVAHVAPEVLRGQRQDERTDVYGLASTLHTLLTGSSPFAGDRDEPVATVMMRIIEAAPPRLGEPVPGDLADLLLSGLAKDPDERPQTAAAFGEALQAIQQAHGVAVTPLRTGATPAPAPTPAAAPVTPVAPPPPEPVEAVVPVVPVEAVEAVVPDGDDSATVTVPVPTTEESPVLAPPPPAPSAAPPPPPTAASVLPEPVPVPAGTAPVDQRRRRSPLLIGGAVAVVLVLVVGAAIILLGGGGDDGDQPGTFTTDAFASSPSAVAFNDDAVWVTDSADTLLYKLDPETGEEITNTGLNNVGTAMALTDDGAGWIIGDDTREMIRIDLATAGDTNQVDIGDNMTSISATGTDVWIARGAEGETASVVRFDSIELSSVTEIEVGTAPSQIAATSNAIWVTSTGDDTVIHIDPSSNDIVNSIDLDAAPSAIAATDDAVWVVSTESAKLTRVDPVNGVVVASIDLGDGTGPVAVAATSTAVWVVATETDRVLRIDPATNTVTDEVQVSHEPVAVAATDTDVWVANSGDGTLTHIDPAAFA